MQSDSNALERIERQLERIGNTLDEHTKLLNIHSSALLDQGTAMHDMLRILDRIEERLRHPGQNGSNP